LPSYDTATLERSGTVVVTTGTLRRLLFGRRAQIAGTVYGTVVVMGTVAAGGSQKNVDPWRLAVFVTVTVVVLWIAHVYAHGLGSSIEAGHRLTRAEFGHVAHRELGIALAAVAPVAALVLGALGVLRESSAIWLALFLGLLTLVVQGVRYARVERLGPLATIVSVSLNAALGLVIVGLKALLAH
jgi:hypothetical protein